MGKLFEISIIILFLCVWLGSLRVVTLLVQSVSPLITHGPGGHWWDERVGHGKGDGDPRFPEFSAPSGMAAVPRSPPFSRSPPPFPAAPPPLLPQPWGWSEGSPSSSFSVR